MAESSLWRVQRRVQIFAFAVLAQGGLTRSAAAAGPRAECAPTDERRAVATRVAAAPRIDGKLDDTPWQSCSWQGEFWQRDPQEGPASFATEFCVLFDENAIYVGVLAHDPSPGEIVGLLTRRDESSASDWLSVGIDAFHDRRTAVVFALSPANVQRDSLLYDDGGQQNVNWDAVWDGAAAINPDGWSAELRIPFSQLRFPSGGDHVWGLQVERVVQRLQETDVWSRFPRACSGRVSHFATLAGLAEIPTASRLELMPYLLGGVRDASSYDPRLNLLGNAGIDARYPVTDELKLSVTINPDFGQTEADPADVNLTAYETFLPEKRPFFLDGLEMFRFRLAQGDGDSAVEELFYTRRIGSAPHEEPEEELLEAPPLASPIIGAAKLTGKTASGWSLGVLEAVTGSESVRVRAEDGSKKKVAIEPLTNYGVLSLHKDLRDGRTNVGLVLTGVARRIEAAELDWLHTQAYAGGIGLEHRFWDENWTLQAKLLGSVVTGSREAMIETQQAEQHLFQRPDASHLRYDPNRTSLFGTSAQYIVGKMAGGHFRGALGGDTRSPGFEVNDLGYQRTADYATPWLWLQYFDADAGALVRQWNLNLNAQTTYNYGGLQTESGGNINMFAQLTNLWSGYIGVTRSFVSWDTQALRGGPALRGTDYWSVWAGLTSDARQLLAAEVTFVVNRTDEGAGHRVQLNPLVTLRPKANLQLSVGPTFIEGVDDLQYVDTLEDGAGGSHTVLGRLHSLTVGATFRATYAFLPTLSLQLYAQPFFSAGRTSQYKEVVAPRARSYAERCAPLLPGELTTSSDGMITVTRAGASSSYAFEDADYSVRELRSTVVLRWEFRLGSALLLVWNHQRNHEGEEGTLDLGRDLSGLARERGEHVIMLKLSTWFEA